MDSFLPNEGDTFHSIHGLHVWDGTNWILIHPYENKLEPLFSHLEAWERGKLVLED
ncbi:hypothetical protein LCGC14_0890200 [marine sediment metagenome]|uniref:Uncharacterized protein n=1 Tax=marine sediment metagenome TaxID=412755 RepID=A0A0F9PKA5_9ZZZZ